VAVDAGPESGKGREPRRAWLRLGGSAGRIAGL